MRILEFGDRHNEKIILIHGLNIPWQMWNKQIEIYSSKYHVIVPALSGHDAESEAEFVSVEYEANQIRDYYVKNYGGNVYMVIGMSMGGFHCIFHAS